MTLLNDDTYVEAARAFATRTIQNESKPERRIDAMFHATLSRRPTRREATVLLDQLTAVTAMFAADEPAARAILSIGQEQAPPNADPIELAAYTTIASTILNLDEAITRE